MRVQKKQGILLLALLVALLAVISARVSPAVKPQASSGPETSEDAAQDPETPDPTAPPEPEETKEPQIRDDLPGISLSDWELKLVNDRYVAAPAFAPNVVEIRNGNYFDSRAAEALESFLQAAEQAGYSVFVRAAYRPYRMQANLFFGRANLIAAQEDMEYGEAVEQLARKVVAYPGTSDHQTGLAADIMDNADTKLDADSAERLPLLRWMRSHCAEYGFILRYPKEKQEITGWYEPWHFRYVGKTAAAYIMEHGLCLEEFYEQF